MNTELYSKLNKEDKQHCEIIFQLMKNEAMLATIIYQLNLSNDDEVKMQVGNYLNSQMEDKKTEIGMLIKKLTE